MKALAVLLIFANVVCAFAATAAKPPLKYDGEIAKRAEVILIAQSKFLTRQLKPWDQDASAKFLFNGTSKELDIRSAAHLAFGLAVIARVNNDAAAPDDAIALLKFLLPTHGAGGKLCTDGKPWHNQWQS